jgi:serine/threonine-protein kinase
VLFASGNVPRLADFGLARALGIIATPLTEPGDIIGTLKYMAPEIIQSGGLSPGDGFHPRLDVYSMGAMFYFMLTRELPFDFPRGTAHIYLHILSNGTIPIRERDPSIPQSLANVIDKACSKDPARRFPDAAEFQKVFRSSL